MSNNTIIYFYYHDFWKHYLISKSKQYNIVIEIAHLHLVGASSVIKFNYLISL